jgi:uncharacterized protein (TIGR03000 family)
MTNILTKVLATLAAVAALAWVGSQPASAKDWPDVYVGDTGFTWDQIFRYNPVTSPFGTREPAPARPYYSGRATYPLTTPYAVAPASYYDDMPSSASMRSSDYSYGAYAPSLPARASTAHVRLIVPAGASVWFDDRATRQTGSVRDFDSPELAPGKTYVYHVKARWTENGKEMTRTRQVDVSAGSSAIVVFSRQ